MKTFAKRFGIGQWSFIGPGSEKKWYLSENSPQGAWDHVAEEMLTTIRRKWSSYFPFNDSIVQGKVEKQRKRESVHTLQCRSRYELIQFIALFSLSISSVSTEQWQLYAMNMKANQDSTGQPVFLVDQSIVLGEMKAEVLAHDEEPERRSISFCSNIIKQVRHRFHQKTD